jgi:hypothetical protein
MAAVRGELAVFHGNSAEAVELLAVVERNCPDKPCSGKCSAHQALLDQRWIDGLLFGRWMRDRLLAEEDRRA